MAGKIEGFYMLVVLYSIRSGILSQWSDVVVFWGFSSSTDESILNHLEAVYFGDFYVQEERIAVVQFSVDYRYSDGRCSFEIEHKVDSAKVADNESGKDE